MEDFIQNVSKELGTSPSTARSATAGILGLVRDNAAQGDFQALLGKLPGAAELMGGQEKESEGGLLGGLLGKAAASIGGGLGSAAGVLGMIQQSGLDAAKAGDFVGMFVGYLRRQAGPDLVQRLLAKVPDLAALVK